MEREEKLEVNSLHKKREEKDAADYHDSDFAIFLLDQFFGNPPRKQDYNVGFNISLGNIPDRSRNKQKLDRIDNGDDPSAELVVKSLQKKSEPYVKMVSAPPQKVG